MFVVYIIRCSKIFNALDGPSAWICAPSKTEGVHLYIFNIIAEEKKVKTLKNVFHVIVNIHLMVEKVIQINNGIMIDDNVIVKNQ